MAQSPWQALRYLNGVQNIPGPSWERTVQVVLFAMTSPGSVAINAPVTSNRASSRIVGQPEAIDGTNIWVTSLLDGTVTKLLASDGTTVGIYLYAGGLSAIAFDGTNIWVTDYYNNVVWKLVASTGAVVGWYAVGNDPWGVAFDGTNIWVSNCEDNDVTKFLASTGATIGSYLVQFATPTAMAFDGTNIWVLHFNAPPSVTKLLASTGEILGTYPVGNNSLGIAFDGTNIWVTNTDDNTLTKIGATR